MAKRGRSGNPARRTRPSAPAGPTESSASASGGSPGAGESASGGSPDRAKASSSGRGATPSSAGLRGWDAGLRDPAPGTSYPLLLRVAPTQVEPAPWIRSIIGVMVALLGYAVLVVSVGMLIWQLGWLVSGPGSGMDKGEFLSRTAAYETPWGLAGAHIGIASLILVSAAVFALVHRTKPRWLLSVLGRLRWGLLGWSMLVSVLVMVAVLLVTSLIEGTQLTWQPQAGFWAFLIVIALVTPFQAAAEEVFFRGYLMQALGAFGRTPWVGVVLSAVVFALFHGVQNPALFADRLAFGLLAGVLVWRTGGLETAIAAHVVNNVMAFGLAALTSSVAAARAVQEITWLAAAGDIAGWTALAVALFLLARWRREPTVVPEA